jgi:hypothetical protein
MSAIIENTSIRLLRLLSNITGIEQQSLQHTIRAEIAEVVI